MTYECDVTIKLINGERVTVPLYHSDSFLASDEGWNMKAKCRTVQDKIRYEKAKKAYQEQMIENRAIEREMFEADARQIKAFDGIMGT